MITPEHTGRGIQLTTGRLRSSVNTIVVISTDTIILLTPELISKSGMTGQVGMLRKLPDDIQANGAIAMVAKNTKQTTPLNCRDTIIKLCYYFRYHARKLVKADQS